MIANTVEAKPHALWSQVVGHEKRDNSAFVDRENYLDLTQREQQFETIQNWKLKQNFYRKHLDRYIRKAGIDPISMDSPQRDFSPRETNNHLRVNSFSPLQRTNYLNTKTGGFYSTTNKKKNSVFGYE